jgi:hypothetical protein
LEDEEILVYGGLGAIFLMVIVVFFVTGDIIMLLVAAIMVRTVRPGSEGRAVTRGLLEDDDSGHQGDSSKSCAC